MNSSLNIKNFGRFIKELDTAAGDASRASLQSWHVLSETGEGEEGTTRLCVTDAHILVFCDVPTELLAWACACTPPLLYKRVAADAADAADGDAPQTCYVPASKGDIPAGDLFPYPDIMRVVPADLRVIEENEAVYFDVYYQRKVCRIFDAYKDKKFGTQSYFCPTHSNGNPIHLKIQAEEGIVVGLMPLRSRHQMKAGQANPPAPLNQYLPGLITGRILKQCPECVRVNEAEEDAVVFTCKCGAVYDITPAPQPSETPQPSEEVANANNAAE